MNFDGPCGARTFPAPELLVDEPPAGWALVAGTTQRPNTSPTTSIATSALIHNHVLDRLSVGAC
jgi:hypothetical protein